MDIGTGAATFGGGNSSSSTSTSPAQSSPPSSGQNATPGQMKGASPQTQKSQTPPASSGSQSSAPSPTSTPETFEVKVNGKTVRMSRDEVLNHASMSHAAKQRFEEAAKMKKENESFRETAKKDVIQALMDPSLGLSKDQIRQEFEKWYTREFIEPDTLSPEQLRARDLEERVKRYETQEKETQERLRNEQQEQMTSRERDYLQNQIIQALDGSGLPKTQFFAQRMAFYMRENLVKGWDAPIGMIVDQVKKERQSIMSDITAESDVPTLINLLGEDVINKIRRYDLEQLRSSRKFPPQSSQHQSSSDGYGNPSERGENISMSEVTRRLRELRAGKR